MLIYSNNWPLQEQSYKIFPIFALNKTNRPMYTKTESKDEKMTTNQKKVESSVKKPMPCTKRSSYSAYLYSVSSLIVSSSG